MRFVARLAGVGGLAFAASAVTAIPATASVVAESANAVFVQTDNPSGNTVVAYDLAANGSLLPAGSYPTGGLGGVLNGSVVDHLASQGSLTLDRENHLLYAVNAGSDSVTVFGVHGDHLVRQQVISSGGAFPVSIAVHGNLVYVLNARDGGSVQGYLRLGRTLLRIPTWHRGLGLDPSQTPEFTHTPGQIVFTPDGSKLIVTTKAGSNAIDVFSVGLGGLSATPVVTNLPNAVPFAVTFDPYGHLVVAEAGPNAVATFTVNPDGSVTQLSQAATGQAATCWIVRAGSDVYLSNAGSANVSGYRLSADGTAIALGNSDTDPGTVDATVSSDGRFLLVQTGANGVVDSFRINPDGSLTRTATTSVPGSSGGEGIAAG